MEKDTINFEIKRKIFHMYALVFPLLYFFLDKAPMVILLFLILICTLYLDITRHYNEKVKNYINILFLSIMRPEESTGSFNLSGASFFVLGLFLSALLFPKGLALAGFLILIISDCSAALVGMKIGHNIIAHNKSLEGSITFFITASLISILCYFYVGYNTNFFVIIISCFVTTLVELYSNDLKINDNLLIPLSYGLTTSILNFIFGL